jgi:hypothetical protein
LKHHQIFSPLNLKEGPEISPSQECGSHLEINNLGVVPKKKLQTNLNVSQLSTTCSADVAPQATLQK